MLKTMTMRRWRQREVIYLAAENITSGSGIH